MESGEIKTTDNSEQKSAMTSAMTDKFRQNPWILSTLVLGILSLILIVGNFTGAFGGVTGKVISSDDAGQKLLSFYESTGADGLKLNSVKETSGVYQVNFEYQGAVVPIFITKDGELAGSLSQIKTEVNPSSSSESQEMLKSDKPKVELFVMTHCPYGTQAEKGLIPVMESAIKNKIDVKIRFVHYIMHGEKEDQETLRQVCIREEQGDNYLVYLREFLAAGDSEAALKKANIDKTKLNSCIQNKGEDYYAEDSKLSEGYGVQGSPTLVINGKIVNSGRSPSAFLDTICQAFNQAPDECTSLNLDDKTSSSGFGWTGSSSGSTTAQC